MMTNFFSFSIPSLLKKITVRDFRLPSKHTKPSHPQLTYLVSSWPILPLFIYFFFYVIAFALVYLASSKKKVGCCFFSFSHYEWLRDIDEIHLWKGELKINITHSIFTIWWYFFFCITSIIMKKDSTHLVFVFFYFSMVSFFTPRFVDETSSIIFPGVRNQHRFLRLYFFGLRSSSLQSQRLPPRLPRYFHCRCRDWFQIYRTYLLPPRLVHFHEQADWALISRTIVISNIPWQKLFQNQTHNFGLAITNRIWICIS